MLGILQQYHVPAIARQLSPEHDNGQEICACIDTEWNARCSPRTQNYYLPSADVSRAGPKKVLQDAQARTVIVSVLKAVKLLKVPQMHMELFSVDLPVKNICMRALRVSDTATKMVAGNLQCPVAVNSEMWKIQSLC